MKIVYYSLTGQCRRLANKFKTPIWGQENQIQELHPTNPFVEPNEPYVIIVPSYEDLNVREVFYDFFETGNNIKNCVGMIGSGNRNFGDLYLVTALEMEKLYEIPILYDVEFHGTPRDIEEIETLLEAYYPPLRKKEESQ